MFHAFQYVYHDAHLVSYSLGPRREITLKISLDPVWNKNIKKLVELRFSAINNFDQVASFFKEKMKLPISPVVFIGEVIGLERVDKNTFLIDFGFNKSIEIQSNKYIEI